MGDNDKYEDKEKMGDEDENKYWGRDVEKHRERKKMTNNWINLINGLS